MSDECMVCLEQMWLTKTPCKHVICIGCLVKLQKDECPYCRNKLFAYLPKCLQEIAGMKKRNGLNLNNLDDFPSLS